MSTYTGYQTTVKYVTVNENTGEFENNYENGETILPDKVGWRNARSRIEIDLHKPVLIYSITFSKVTLDTSTGETIDDGEKRVGIGFNAGYYNRHNYGKNNKDNKE